MSEHVKVTDAAGVRTIALARPEKKNAITHAMYTAMAEAVLGAQADPAVRVALITGEGAAFTAGNDLNDFISSPPLATGGETPPVLRFLFAILEAEKPLAAAVNGLAVGVGATLLLHCDLVYAAESATFRFPFTDLGLVPEAGSSLLLPWRIGRARAGEMLLLGETMSPADAHACGLVARVYPDATLLPEARARCEALARKAPEAVRATKRLMRGDIDTVRSRMIEEARLFGERLRSEELKEAVGAFFEKRAPDFSRFS